MDKQYTRNGNPNYVTLSLINCMRVEAALGESARCAREVLGYQRNATRMMDDYVGGAVRYMDLKDSLDDIESSIAIYTSSARMYMRDACKAGYRPGYDYCQK